MCSTENLVEANGKLKGKLLDKCVNCTHVNELLVGLAEVGDNYCVCWWWVCGPSCYGSMLNIEIFTTAKKLIVSFLCVNTWKHIGNKIRKLNETWGHGIFPNVWPDIFIRKRQEIYMLCPHVSLSFHILLTLGAHAQRGLQQLSCFQHVSMYLHTGNLLFFSVHTTVI